MSLYASDYEHHTGRALGRIHELCEPGQPDVSTGRFCWWAWRRTGKTISGVATDRYEAEDLLENAMEALA